MEGVPGLHGQGPADGSTLAPEDKITVVEVCPVGSLEDKGDPGDPGRHGEGLEIPAESKVLRLLVGKLVGGVRGVRHFRPVVDSVPVGVRFGGIGSGGELGGRTEPVTVRIRMIDRQGSLHPVEGVVGGCATLHQDVIRAGGGIHVGLGVGRRLGTQHRLVLPQHKPGDGHGEHGIVLANVPGLVFGRHRQLLLVHRHRH